MGAATDISGRFIRFHFRDEFEANSTPVDMEVLSGSVVEELAEQNSYLPVGRRVTNFVGHGHSVSCNITAALLIKNLPWNLYDTTLPTVPTGYLTTLVKKLSVGRVIGDARISLNRGGTSSNDDFYEEQQHVFRDATVTRLEHVFDTSTHQIFNLSFVADGYYYPPHVNIIT